MPEFRDFEKEATKLRERLNQLFSGSPGEIEQPEPMDETEWTPSMDILENKDDIIVKVDIPGMNPYEIELSISGSILQIRGDRKREVEREDENYYTIERGYGKFNRHLVLPTLIKVDRIKASYKDGVLTIKLPKLEKEAAGKVKVKLEEPK